MKKIFSVLLIVSGVVVGIAYPIVGNAYCGDDYRLTLTTASNSIYAGYFTLE